MNNEYQYSPLREGSIRLIRLVSIAPEVIIGFETVTLDSSPIYNALSYTWGEPVFSRRISIQGQYLNVTPGLRDCFQNLREHTGMRIWIDALCINQKDEVEKSHQVRNMDRIYQQATKVLIWLGNKADDSDVAMKGFNTWGKAAADAGILDLDREHFMAWPAVGEGAELLEKRDAILRLIQQAIRLENDFDRQDQRIPRLAFAALSRRSYFTRVWVKQEITLAKDAIVLCGQCKTTAECCHAFILFLALLIPAEADELEEKMQNPETLTKEELVVATNRWELQRKATPSNAFGPAFSGRRRYRKHGREPLYDLLRQTYMSPSMQVLCCQNPRDKIWGLLGLANDVQELELQVSYTIKTELVYETTARALLGQGHIDLLKWCSPDVASSCSWVPNWALPLRNPWSEDSGRPLFKASGDRFQPNLQDNCDPSTSSICLQGLLVDVVLQQGSVWQTSHEEFNHEGCQVMIRDLVGFLVKSQYPEGKQMDALSRIPIGDKELPPSGPNFVRATNRSKEQFLALTTQEFTSVANSATYSYQTCMGYNQMARPILSRDHGFVGLGPSHTMPGDIIVVLFGGSTPFILRPRASVEAGYLLIGEAYVYGIMDGELINDSAVEASFRLC